jgi:hypothetical protein
MAKKSQQVRDTHQLSSVEGRKNQYSERKSANEGALTSCPAQRGGLVRITKEGQLRKVTHVLSSLEGGTRQETEKGKRAEGTHPLSS